MPNKSSKPIAFRADETLLKLIDKAAKPMGLSPGEWVKNVVIEKVMELHEPHVDEPPMNIDATLESTKHELLRAVARSLFFVLTNPDGLTDEEASRIAREEILKPKK
jgi:hypothetical protein